MKLACILMILAAESMAQQSLAPERIAWYGTWETGAAVAKATGRPILLVAAAPQCRNISGMW